MNNKLQTINQILQEAQKVNLYDALVVQLNKDFNLAGLSSLKILASVTPKELQFELRQIITQLINTDFDGFLSFLYRIDLSENTIKSLPKSDHTVFVNQIVLLVLKREWMKVWYRNQYS